MAFYSHNFYREDLGDYNLYPSEDSYSYAPDQSSMDYSSYEFNVPNFIDYGTYDDTYNYASGQSYVDYSSYEFSDPKFIDYGTYDETYNYAPDQVFTEPVASYSESFYSEPKFIDYAAYDHVMTGPVISYSASFVSEPKVVEYEPSTYYIDEGYNLLQTKYLLSYSVSNQEGFNEDDDVDYDPTPYDGGYDPVMNYGRPLSPSNEICYPHSAHGDSKAPSMNNFSDGPLALPSTKKEVEEKLKKPQVEETKGDGPLALPSTKKETEEAFEKPQVEETKNDHENDVKEKDLALAMAMALAMVEEEPEEKITSYRPIWSDYEHDYKNKNGKNEEEYGCHRDMKTFNEWKGTADYLFGSSNSCGDWRVEAGMFDSPIFGYEKHYQEPLQHVQIAYDEQICETIFGYNRE